MAKLSIELSEAQRDELVQLGQQYHGLENKHDAPSRAKRATIRARLAGKLIGIFITHLRVTGKIKT